MEIACIADRGYLRHVAAMLRSAVEHGPPATWKVHVLHASAVDDEDRDRLLETLADHCVDVTFHHVDRARIAGLPEGYFPSSVWLRIFLPDLLPETRRLLYLDADTIVTDHLGPLWSTDLGDNLLGAVSNPLYPFQPPYAREQLGIDDPLDYFNSGVLLMDLDAMREADVVAELVRYALAHPGNWYPDQDALNVVLRDRWSALHPRWNVQTTLFELRSTELPFPPDIVREALAHPAIVHYIGPFKPWRYMCTHPLQELYLAQAAQTPWGVPTYPDRTLKNVVLRRLPLAWLDRIGAVERDIGRRWPRLGTYLADHPVVA